MQNGKKVTADIRYKTLEEDNTYTLLILETVPEDSGKYECVAINSAGEARCDAECTVRGPQSPAKTAKPTTPGVEKAPTVLEPLRDQTIREGTSVAFACRITGKPVPTVQWKKGDKVRTTFQKSQIVAFQNIKERQQDEILPKYSSFSNVNQL